ncbi:nose resistant to fluoxetine protein 6-like isoform X2 [Chironomus tepperi]|uniref:nose resistant to fluoxetine protein 6-like isoform X2 n=1 Tax=Chironomus tepperi TaxID=113505 RepID=UPI00391F8EEF
MSKAFNFKLISIAIFLLLAIAVKNCENFQLRDVSSPSETKNVGTSKTKIRFPFRKLEKVNDKEEDDETIDDDDDDNNDIDDDDTDDENDTDNDSSDEKIESEIYKNYKFTKVRKPTIEIKKKREDLRFSKLAQFREDSSEDEQDNDEEENVSFFSKFFDFFKSKSTEIDETKMPFEENDDDENDSSDLEDKMENEEENISKPMLVEMYDKFKSFLEARNHDRNAMSESEEDNDDDNDNVPKNVGSNSEEQPEEQIDTDMKSYDDSEEDEINYQKLLKEEREQEKFKTESLINQIIEEETQKIVDKSKSEIDSDDEDNIDEEKQDIKVSENIENVSILRNENKPKKTKQELHLAQIQFEKLLLNLPSFVPDYTKVKNPECQKQGEVFQRQLRGQKIWALQMMDANAKIPSGLLRGNVNQLGDFDLCTKISQKIKISESNIIKMKGKYCLANIDVVAAVDQLKLPVHLMQGRNFIRSTINDPNHFFPRYSTINWGLCLPSACSFNDADHILESFIGPYNSSGIKLHISVDEDSCYMRKSAQNVDLIKSDWKIFGTCFFIFLTISATVLSTLNEYLDSPFMSTILNSKSKSIEENDEKKEESKNSTDPLPNKILSCFSLKRNLKALWDDSNAEEIKCIHGLKSISIILLFISLRLIPMGRVPYTNRNKFTEFFNSPLTVFLRSSFLYEDVFLVISGLLSTLSIIKEISVKGKIVWLKKILGRYLRLLLPLIFVLLFYAYIFENIGTGPQWNLISKNAELCQDNMWKNLLFVQNLYPFEEMCVPQSYHLAIDLQLFILTPLLVWLIYKNPTYGFGIYGILHTLSAGARFSTALDFRLSTVVFHGMKLSQLYRTFSLSFTVALHRATPYLIGIALGILIKEFGRIKLSKGATYSGWVSTITSLIWCFYKPSNLSHKDFQYDPISAAQYSGLAPLLWSLSIAWIIFACYNDASWKLNNILSSKIMIFFSRISYSIFLVTFIIFFYYSGTLKSSEEFHVSSYLDRMETFVVFVAATLFTLVVDMPTQNIVKLILNSNYSASSSVANEIKEEEKPSEDDIDNIFGNEEDDYVFRPVKSKYFNDEGVNDEHINGNVKEKEPEKDDESESENVVEAKFEIKPKTTMNARRWKWEVSD